jgi:hypothetical protein
MLEVDIAKEERHESPYKEYKDVELIYINKYRPVFHPDHRRLKSAVPQRTVQSQMAQNAQHVEQKEVKTKSLTSGFGKELQIG